METYLPVIKNTIAQLYQFTLDNPLYAATIAALVWLLMATFYSIRIAILNRRNRFVEQARAEAQAALEATQQQVQQHQEELARNAQQMEQDKITVQQQSQRLATTEELIGKRNQGVAALLQTLATQLDLGERPVPVPEDIRADELWQQHDRISRQLLDRLRNEQQAKTELQQAYQTETAKLAEKEVMLATMRTTLDLQTNQIAGLEAALAEQKHLLQQHQERAASVAVAPEKPEVQFFQPAPALEPQITPAPAATPVETAPELTFLPPQQTYQPARVLEEAVQVVQSVVEQSQVTPAPAPAAAPEPVADFRWNTPPAEPFRNAPNNFNPAPASSTPQPAPTQPSSLEQEYIELGLADAIYAKNTTEPAKPSKEGMGGKLKGLFGKKDSAPAPKPEPKEDKQGKGWLGKLKPKK